MTLTRDIKTKNANFIDFGTLAFTIDMAIILDN